MILWLFDKKNKIIIFKSIIWSTTIQISKNYLGQLYFLVVHIKHKKTWNDLQKFSQFETFNWSNYPPLRCLVSKTFLAWLEFSLVGIPNSTKLFFKKIKPYLLRILKWKEKSGKISSESWLKWKRLYLWAINYKSYLFIKLMVDQINWNI